jgi:DNA replication protein DnaC
MELTNRTIASIDPQLIKIFRGLISAELPWPLFINGAAGSGKTCASLALIDHVDYQRHLQWSDCASDYHTVRQLCSDLIDRQQKRDEYETAGKIWRKIESCAVSVLDELGSRKEVSDFHYETVCEHLDRRAFKPSIYISNLNLNEIAKLYDDRVASRLASGTLFTLKGNDRRIDR